MSSSLTCFSELQDSWTYLFIKEFRKFFSEKFDQPKRKFDDSNSLTKWLCQFSFTEKSAKYMPCPHIASNQL
jgi:hypothetical protein